MRYAVVRGEKVINTIVLEDSGDYHTEDLLIQSDTANTGDAWNGESFVKTIEFGLAPDWGVYNRSLLTNTAYNRVSQATTNQASVRRLESIAIAAGVNKALVDIDIMTILWNDMIDGVPLISKLTAKEAEGWRAIALSAFMPFSFAADGKMVLN
jgi:hypothetical protein